MLNLRNLGSYRTLVLFDDHRIPPTLYDSTVDVDLIPQELIRSLPGSRRRQGVHPSVRPGRGIAERRCGKHDRSATGSGPRHLVFSPDGRFAFVNTELTGAVYVFRWNAAAGMATRVMHVALDPVDFTGQRSAAELLVSRDGRFLYVSNRGADVVQVFSIEQRTGALRSLQRINAGGKSPWSVALDPSDRWFIVANEATNNLAVFARNQQSGMLAYTGQSLSTPQPTALAFFR